MKELKSYSINIGRNYETIKKEYEKEREINNNLKESLRQKEEKDCLENSEEVGMQTNYNNDKNLIDENWRHLIENSKKYNFHHEETFKLLSLYKVKIVEIFSLIHFLNRKFKEELLESQVQYYLGEFNVQNFF